MGLKERILVIAFEMFKEQGYEQTTIEGIIKGVGCSKGGFYHHYKSKEDILNQYIANDMKELADYFSELTISNNESFEDQFNRVYEFVTEYKIKQSRDWDKIQSVFSYSKNIAVMRKMERSFKELVTSTYKFLLENANRDYKDQEILAEFCTRQFMWIYECSTLAGSNRMTMETFKKTVLFCEKTIATQLNVECEKICFMDASLKYVDTVMNFLEGQG